MSKAKKGDTVKVHYTGKLKDGSVFDSSDGRDPLQFTLGAGQMIPGFDSGVEGMELDEDKTIEIPADEAYGQRREELVTTISRDQVPQELELKEGLVLQMSPPDAPPMLLTVAELTDDTVTLDANHQLAGQDLIFDVKVVEIVEG